MVALAMRSTTAAGHSLVDHVLPVRVLSNATPEETQQIADRLGRLQAPGYFSWIGAVSVLLLSGYALWSANRLERVSATKTEESHDTPTA